MRSEVLGIDLHDAGRDGVYSAAPDDVDTLLADTARAGLHPVQVDLTGAGDDAEVRALIARAFAVPGDGTESWATLCHGLGDLRWIPEPGCVLLLRHAWDLARRAPQVYRELWNRLDGVTRAWYARGVPFFVFLEWPDDETRDAAIDA